MNENKQSSEYRAPAEAEPTYQTGSTDPPKSHVGIVSFLLSAVIFFCGISTILSLMRINLLQTLTAQAESRQCSLSFVSEAETRSAAQDMSELGFRGQTLSAFWQTYHALPEGVFITCADTDQAVRPGDVLLALDSQPVTTWEELLDLLKNYEPGDSVRVTVYRNGSQKQLPITIYD